MSATMRRRKFLKFIRETVGQAQDKHQQRMQQQIVKIIITQKTKGTL